MAQKLTDPTDPAPVHSLWYKTLNWKREKRRSKTVGKWHKNCILRNTGKTQKCALPGVEPGEREAVTQAVHRQRVRGQAHPKGSRSFHRFHLQQPQFISKVHSVKVYGTPYLYVTVKQENNFRFMVGTLPACREYLRRHKGSCSAQTQTRIGLLEEISRSGVQIPCLYYWAT